ncbi:replication fork protection component Swi3-domain-containing protein [Tricladium varicosporioides]|nr:replication fork protection component Swi3-domain-containing protein [Hymenoscyphus varicosporioides]
MSSEVTNRPLPTEGPSAGGEQLDDLFDYDLDMEDDPFAEPLTTTAPPKLGAGNAGNNARKEDKLGIDDEVEQTRKPRAPRVKLDEHRLLSAAGIPKLRKRAKDHLKFKGKGHEYSDATRLLQFYQLWLDDLFPKARFLDALAMVEKMGHKRMMQVARIEWINEGKPKSSVHDDSLFDEPTLSPREDGDERKTAEIIAPIFEKKDPRRPKTPDIPDDMGDLYDATPKATRIQPPQTIAVGEGQSIFGPRKPAPFDEFEDDMDALLAEEEIMRVSSKAAQQANKPAPPRDEFGDEFEDDLAAMAEMEGM